MNISMKTDLKELRKFSIILFLAFAILGLIILWRKGESGLLFCGFGLALLLCGLAYPKLLKHPYRGWITLSLFLGFLASHLILLLTYYLVFTPIGVIMRIFGKEFLNMNFDKNAKTYWIEKEQRISAKERYEKMF